MFNEFAAINPGGIRTNKAGNGINTKPMDKTSRLQNPKQRKKSNAMDGNIRW